MEVLQGDATITSADNSNVKFQIMQGYSFTLCLLFISSILYDEKNSCYSKLATY